MEPVPGYRVLGKINLYYIIYGNAFYLVFLLLMPIVILSALNARLITSLKALKRKRADMQSLRQQQDNNVTFVLIVVVLVFIVCQVPATVNQVLWNIVSDDSRVCGGFHFYLRHIANALVILNSSVNFAIYTAFNTRFRRVLVREVCPRRIRACLRRLSPAHSTTATAAADEPTFTATVNRATPVSRVTPDRAVADIPLAGETTSDFAAPASNVENGVKDTLL